MGAGIVLGLIYAIGIAYVASQYADTRIGWPGFFGTWAGLTILQWIFRPLAQLLLFGVGLWLLGTAAYGVWTLMSLS